MWLLFMAEFEFYLPLTDREQVLDKFESVISKGADTTDQDAFELTADVHASSSRSQEEQVFVEDIYGVQIIVEHYEIDLGEVSSIGSLPDHETDRRLNLLFTRKPDGSILVEELDFVAEDFLPITFTPVDRISYLKALQGMYLGEFGQLLAI